LPAVARKPQIASLFGVPVHAVGARTAEAAREFGFHNTSSAGGTVADLANLVRAEIAPGEGRLVHLSGRDAAGDIAGTLARAGYETQRIVVYEAVPAEALPADAVEALRDGRVEAVLLYSPRSAEAFAGLVRQAGLGERLADISAVAISQNVAETARIAGFGHVSVAAATEESALFDALSRLLGK
jgi:uroporphyrinogen-III synthase